MLLLTLLLLLLLLLMVVVVVVVVAVLVVCQGIILKVIDSFLPNANFLIFPGISSPEETFRFIFLQNFSFGKEIKYYQFLAPQAIPD
jgi:hypothetical protein